MEVMWNGGTVGVKNFEGQPHRHREGHHAIGQEHSLALLKPPGRMKLVFCFFLKRYEFLNLIKPSHLIGDESPAAREAAAMVEAK